MYGVVGVKMRMPPLSFVSTTGRPLNLKNAALWAFKHVKTAAPGCKCRPRVPQQQPGVLYTWKIPPFELPARWKRRPKIQMPPLSSANTTGRHLNMEKCRPLSFPTKDSEPENGVRCECRPWVSQSQSGALSPKKKCRPLSSQPSESGAPGSKCRPWVHQTQPNTL